jgi:hypothetical protein
LANRDVATLSESDVRRFTMARRQGDPSLKGVALGKPVRDRTIELDKNVVLHPTHRIVSR